jgi:hypothetical protein
MSNLNSISASLDGVLKKERTNIEGIVASLNGLAEMLDQNTERFDRIIGNVDAVAEQLEQAKVDSLVKAFTATADNLSRMLASINAGEGEGPYDQSVGKQLVYVPEYSASVGARLAWRSWRLGYKGSYYSQRFTTSANTSSP